MTSASSIRQNSIAWMTAAAMVAFAANSVICRVALGGGLMDAASFTTVRVVAGALMMGLLAAPAWRRNGPPRLNGRQALALFGYMICFSFAYVTLGAGTGALILFGAVQLTMFAAGLAGGERFGILQWSGLLIAVAGLVYLLLPGSSAPDPVGSVLMVLAGVSWGFYSLLGRGATQPLAATAANFICCVPLVLVTSGVFLSDMQYTPRGLTLAIASGALASGLGYVLWYSALRGLSATGAATVQLSVPVIAAFGGVVFIAEPVTARLLIASALTLGGVAIVLTRRAA